MRTVGSKIAGSFAVAALLLIIVGVLAFISFRKLNANIQWVDHTHLVIENLENVLLLLDEAETGQRGFIITGRNEYLEPYNTALAGIDQRIQTVRRLTRDNPRQQARLDQLTGLVKSKTAELQKIIALRKGPGGLQAAITEVKTNKGKRIMDEIRAVVGQMEEEERALLAQRTRVVRASDRMTLLVIAVGISACVIFLALLAVALTRSIAVPLARLTAAAEQIAAGNMHTEIPLLRRHDEIGVLQQGFRNMQQRVQERTAALEASNEALRQSEERLRLMIDSVKDYAIITLDPDGLITSWNVGAERIKGYRPDEILGKSFAVLYLPEDVAAGKPQTELQQALANGRFEEEWWRVRKDGSRFWASVVITPFYAEDGTLLGLVKITRDMSERRRAEEESQALNADLLRRTAELETSNKELEGFSYSVAHDLRSPLRSLDGFSQYLLAHTADRLQPQEQEYLQRMRKAAQRMGHLIDDLLNLARISRMPMKITSVDLSVRQQPSRSELRKRDPDRQAVCEITPGIIVQADRELLQIALAHLLDNAWKFTGTRNEALIVVGMQREDNIPVYFVRDNGVGFDMAYSDTLFKPFHRLHTEEEFPGTGIGLALVQRIIQRHGGRIWAKGAEGEGATLYFTVGDQLNRLS